MPESPCEHCGSRIPASSRFCPDCGSSLGGGRPSDTAAEGTAGLWDVLKHRLHEASSPRYRILRLLGSGGMAGVYLGEEPRLARKVAIKVMAPSLMMDPRMVERFHQEARSTARLSHPHIVTIHEIDEREGLHYFVMSYVEGPTLDQILKEAEEPLAVATVRRWLFQIAGALNHAHRAGIVHRDVKPGNVLVDPDGNAVVTDFGIAKVADEPGLTRTGMLVGTPSYMSPEQCMGGEVTWAADQYALGALGYHLLTGRPPFTGPAMAVLQAHLSDLPRPMVELRPDCPPAMAELVHRMLAKNPVDRWGSMSEVVAALEEVGPTTTVTNTAPSPAPHQAPPASRTAPTSTGRLSRPLVLAGLAVPVVLLALVFLLRDGGGGGAGDGGAASPGATAGETGGEPPSLLDNSSPTGAADAASAQLQPPVSPPSAPAPASASTSTSASASASDSPSVPPSAPPSTSTQTPTPAPAPASDQAAAPASVEVVGPLPPGARLVALGNAGAIPLVPGDAVELPAGRYLLEASAQGFAGDQREVELGVGQRLRWTPTLTASPPGAAGAAGAGDADAPPSAPATFDADAVRQELEGSLEALAAAFRSRDMARVLALYPDAPEEWRERWEAVVVNTEQIRELDVSVLDLEHRQTRPDGADVQFVLALDFVDFRNRANEQRHAFIASFLPGPNGWVLSNLRSAP